MNYPNDVADFTVLHSAISILPFLQFQVLLAQEIVNEALSAYICLPGLSVHTLCREDLANSTQSVCFPT